MPVMMPRMLESNMRVLQRCQGGTARGSRRQAALRPLGLLSWKPEARVNGGWTARACGLLTSGSRLRASTTQGDQSGLSFNDAWTVTCFAAERTDVNAASAVLILKRMPLDRLFSLFAAATLLATGGEGTLAENWPGWRGPSRNAVSGEKGLPLRWSATEGVRWKAPLPGSGVSSPIVWGDQVIATSSDGKDSATLHVIALDRRTGREQWHGRFWGTAPTLSHGTKSNMATPAPVTDGQHVYAFFGTGDLFCIDM